MQRHERHHPRLAPGRELCRTGRFQKKAACIRNAKLISSVSAVRFEALSVARDDLHNLFTLDTSRRNSRNVSWSRDEVLSPGTHTRKPRAQSTNAVLINPVGKLFLHMIDRSCQHPHTLQVYPLRNEPTAFTFLTSKVFQTCVRFSTALRMLPIGAFCVQLRRPPHAAKRSAFLL